VTTASARLAAAVPGADRSHDREPFVVVEHRVAQPLIAPALMGNRTFAAATLVALVFAACAFGPLVALIRTR